METTDDARLDPERMSIQGEKHDGVGERAEGEDHISETDTRRGRSPIAVFDDLGARGSPVGNFADLMQAMNAEEWSQCANECINSSNQLKEHVGSASGIMLQLNKLLNQYITLVAEMSPMVEHVRNVNKLQFKIEKLNEIYMPLQQLTNDQKPSQTRKED